MTRFAFRFDPAYRLAALPFGVTPRTTIVEVADGRFMARFGPWRLHTDLQNIAGHERTGPFGFLKTAGPAHLSFADRGLTFATNGDAGLCVCFVEPVPGIAPWGRIRHPAVTVTVDRIDELAAVLNGNGGQ